MYAPAPFAHEDADEMLAVMRAHPFAQVLVNGPDAPLAAHLPLAVKTDDVGVPIALVGHIARENPLWRAAQDSGRALVLFIGPSAYVSPSLYPSKSEHGKVVPTWNYIAVEARGAISIETDPAFLLDYVETATALMETQRDPAWNVSDAPENYITSLLRAIVGVRIVIDELRGKKKLSQNKPQHDFEAVRAAFAASTSEDERALAAAMDKIKR